MTIYQLDDARPFLVHSGQPVQWHAGSAPLMGLMSSLVRVNARGITYKPSAWHPRPPMPETWRAERCTPSAYGLCETNTSVMFPSQQTPLVNEALDGLCNAQNTGQAVTATSRYDISACDVLDAGYDFIVYSDTLHTSTVSNLPVWIYWTVCLLVIYLVRCLSKYILTSLSKEKSYPDPVQCVLACAACLVLVVSQGDFVYATEEEFMFYHFTIFYVVIYTCIFISSRAMAYRHGPQTDPPFYNLLAGVMLLVACRLYCGAETPYNPPLIFIIATRLLVKSRRGSDPVRAFTVLLDALILSLACNLGFGPSHHYLVALAAAAGAASDVLVVA